MSRAARCETHAMSRHLHPDCGPCADQAWRLETQTFAKPSESLEKFRARWRRHMLALIGYMPRAAMPSVQTDQQFAAEIRRHNSRRIVTAFAETHRPDRWTNHCGCVDCARGRWDQTIAGWNGMDTAAAA
jgi:hypothetical protein